MDQFAALTLVLLAELVTTIATGVSAIPLFFALDVSDHWNVTLRDIASDVMASAPLFGLVFKGLANGTPLQPGVGMLVDVALVFVARHIVKGTEINPKQYEEADFRKLLSTLGIFAVHSFSEGVAVGVSFANLGLDGGFQLFSFIVPLLTVFMTLVILIHDVPEELAISIPLRSMSVSNWKLVWWAIFSSLPQPIDAAIAFCFIRIAREFLPFGFGFAAGAMVFLVLTEFIPETLELGEHLPCGGRVEPLVGLTADFAIMVLLAFI